jgi:Cft2 family RNA processing exonuclease
MKIKFIGAVGHVTGSCTLLDYPRTGIKFLVDCGMSQGEPNSKAINQSPWAFKPSELSFVLLTHAHLDHCGLIPRLYKDGFTGTVICTRFTAKLVQLNLRDAANHSEAPFKINDVDQIRFDHIDDRENFGLTKRLPIADDLYVAFLRSSHIGGACALAINWKDTRDNWVEIVFSGDVGNNTEANSYQPLLAHRQTPLDYSKYIVLETTYGDRVRDEKFANFDNRISELSKIVHSVIQNRRGPIVIPCFSIHRTQEFIFDLHYVLETQLHDEDDYIPFLKDNLAVEDVLANGLHAKNIEGEKSLISEWPQEQRDAWLSSFRRVEINLDNGSIQPKYFPVDQTDVGLDIAREMLRALRRKRTKKITVCVDSPLAQKVTDVYRIELKRRKRHKPDQPIYRSRQLTKRLGLETESEVDDLFDRLFLNKPTKEIVRSIFQNYELVFCTAKESLERLSGNETVILITGGGMCDGGPVIEHLSKVLPNKDATIVLTGYAPPSSIAGKLRDFPNMAQELRNTEEIQLGANSLQYSAIKAHFEDIGSYYSGHADQKGLLDFLFQVIPCKDNKPNKARVFLNHGDNRKRLPFAEAIKVRIEESRIGDRRICSVEIPNKDHGWFNFDTDSWLVSTVSEETSAETDLLQEMVSEQRKTNELLSRLISFLEGRK